MIVLVLICLVAALVFFAMAGLGVPNPPRLNFLGWGAFFMVLAQLIPSIVH